MGQSQAQKQQFVNVQDYMAHLMKLNEHVNIQESQNKSNIRLNLQNQQRQSDQINNSNQSDILPYNDSNILKNFTNFEAKKQSESQILIADSSQNLISALNSSNQQYLNASPQKLIKKNEVQVQQLMPLNPLLDNILGIEEDQKQDQFIENNSKPQIGAQKIIEESKIEAIEQQKEQLQQQQQQQNIFNFEEEESKQNVQIIPLDKITVKNDNILENQGVQQIPHIEVELSEEIKENQIQELINQRPLDQLSQDINNYNLQHSDQLQEPGSSQLNSNLLSNPILSSAINNNNGNSNIFGNFNGDASQNLDSSVFNNNNVSSPIRLPLSQISDGLNNQFDHSHNQGIVIGLNFDLASIQNQNQRIDGHENRINLLSHMMAQVPAEQSSDMNSGLQSQLNGWISAAPNLHFRLKLGRIGDNSNLKGDNRLQKDQKEDGKFDSNDTSPRSIPEEHDLSLSYDDYLDNYMCLMKGITWGRESHGLFDYGTRHPMKKQMKTEIEQTLVRTQNNDLYLVNTDTDLTKVFDKQAQPLLNIRKQKNKYFLEALKVPKKDDLIPHIQSEVPQLPNLPQQQQPQQQQPVQQPGAINPGNLGNAAAAAQDDQQNNCDIRERMYLIVRSMQNGEQKVPYKIKRHDVIKLGRVLFKVVEMRIDEIEQQREFKRWKEQRRQINQRKYQAKLREQQKQIQLNKLCEHNGQGDVIQDIEEQSSIITMNYDINLESCRECLEGEQNYKEIDCLLPEESVKIKFKQPSLVKSTSAMPLSKNANKIQKDQLIREKNMISNKILPRNSGLGASVNVNMVNKMNNEMESQQNIGGSRPKPQNPKTPPIWIICEFKVII